MYLSPPEGQTDPWILKNSVWLGSENSNVLRGVSEKGIQINTFNKYPYY